VIPIILNSDVTHLDKLGHQKVHPVYMTIGNIPKEICQKSNQCAIVLLGYLPILEATSQTRKKASFRKAKHEVFHAAMKVILEPLMIAAKK
jgi:hypothetical protein